ncbi:hypothetical protein NKG05_17715 [Oerskovia sp. M15]
MQVDPQAGCGQPDLGAAPSGDAATAAARDVLASLGVDPAGYEYSTESFDEEGKVVSVTASQVLEGSAPGPRGTSRTPGRPGLAVRVVGADGVDR